MAAAETAATETAAGGGGGVSDDSRRNRGGGGGGGNIEGKVSTSTHECLRTYIECYRCICKFLFVAQIALPPGTAICATNRNLRIHK